MAPYIFFLIAIAFLAFKALKLSGELRKLRVSLIEAESDLRDKTAASGMGEAKLEGVLSSMAEGVLVVDKSGKIALINPSLRRTFLINTPPERKRPIEVVRNIAVQEMVDRALKGKEALVSQEIALYLPEEKTFRVNAVPVARNDAVEDAILVFHDITELRRLERIRQDFVANVSHELRTPLASIKGYAETLREGALVDKANAKDFIDIIYHDSDRLGRLINDLLDLSKIESGQLNMVFVPMDVLEVARRAVAIVSGQAKKKSIAVTLDMPQELPEVLGDESRLSQVLLNLLDNAIKYTPEGGSIKIAAHSEDDSVRVDVTDAGIGIPENDLPRIFERFYRVDKGRSRELGGTGLGLSIVRHIVQAHSGRVWVKSEPGRGSTFSFTIPTA